MKRLVRKPLIWLLWKTTKKRVGRRVICMHEVTDKFKFLRRMEWLARNYIVAPMYDVLNSGPDREHVVTLTFDDGSETWFRSVMPVLADLGLSAVFFVNRSDDMVRRIENHKDSHLWTVGGHTRGHTNLGKLVYPSVLNTLIEKRPLFAYPYGTPKDYNQTTIWYMNTKSHVDYAFTCIPGWVETGVRCFELPRDSLDIWDPEWYWRARLAGGYDWLYKVIHRRSWK